MSTIWKYKLFPGRTELEMPRGAELLTVQMQDSVPTLWALVYPAERLEGRVMHIYSTGQGMPPDPGVYVATVQDELGLVWHVFDATLVG
jgi:hypothetical protein